MTDEPTTSVVASTPVPVKASRHLWVTACSQVAWISGIFSLILGGLLLFNTFHLYQFKGNGRLRLVEASELQPLKSALRKDPHDETLKQQIRLLDQQLRIEYFRRELLATRGGWILAGGAALFLSAWKLGGFLKRPTVTIPNISASPGDPASTSALAAKALTITTFALAALAIAMLWDTSSQWLGNPAKPGSPPAESDPNTFPVVPADWFPSDAEIARNWPRFRGPDGTGVTQLTDLPEFWDGPSAKNVLWKSEIGLPGENSPIVWGKRVFVTGATAKRREIYCFDADSGSLLWKKPVSTPQSDRAEAPEVIKDTGFAASTAVTDGRRVFAIFANGDIAGFSTEGKPLWARWLGTPENAYGHACSLTMWRNRVIVVFDQGVAKSGKSKIIALDAASGESVWSTPRPVANSWVTPISIQHQNRDQIVTSADPWVIAYDPATGSELWKAICMKGDVASSPTFANGLVYVACDHTNVAAIKPDGSGDVTDSGFAWKQNEAGLPDMCSLLSDGPRIYTLVYGSLHAFDALTGAYLWEHDTKADFQASPSLVNGRIHLLTKEGVMIIGVGDHTGFTETGRAMLGEGAGASPAFAPGHIYLRGRKHLFCIGTKDET